MNHYVGYEKKINDYREKGFPKIWVADQGDGTYTNPILYADYSDPDIIRVGEDFYMVASSFQCVPGLPILHSKDLVNWKLINHVIGSIPYAEYDAPQHGKGVWAPSIRYHGGYYWVFVGMPDEGIFMSKTRDPYQTWEAFVCIKETRGWIDTCPFWDDDGTLYLVNGFAKSRIGFKSVLAISKLEPDGKSVTDEFRIVFDGNESHATIEGPKLYKRNGYYYISAPAGGVETGYQVILRSKNIYGPYEDKIVLHQGNTSINGPHQGGWVELENGEFWFMHFQERDAYGRIVHLQPMFWEDDWPVMGINQNKAGIGEPVVTYKKPGVKVSCPIEVPETSDDFRTKELGLQWQWHGNPKEDWYNLDQADHLRLYAQYYQKNTTLWEVSSLLLQKFPAPEFRATVKIELSNLEPEDQIGFVVMGLMYKGIFIKRREVENGYEISDIHGDAIKGEVETNITKVLNSSIIYLQINVREHALCEFSYSFDGNSFQNVGSFSASKGKWIGAKFGLVCWNREKYTQGNADVDWCIVE